ncbi:MAG: hypothetical protein QNJ40_26045 [Xanthomonadales bacterium]|nr:hypothetical protein [Xanthomonadales bacterium]
MTDLNLLDWFALFNTQVVKLHAELHKNIRPDDNIQARVEIKLTPAQLPDSGELTRFQVGVRLLCEGTMQSDPDSPAFTIECVLNAGYQQISGEAIGFEEFSSYHTSLTRQLYPLIHQQLVPLLSQLGLPQVRLPQDIVHTKAGTTPQQVH